MVECLEGLKGIIVIADDILVYGCGLSDEEARRDHDENLRNVLRRCREKKLKINKEKIMLRKEEIKYIGHIISK